MSLPDATQELQRTISDAYQSGEQVELEKGDNAVQTLEIPRNCKLLLFSKDRVRILFSGKRNRPLFVLQQNSVLTLQEKIEIYYNTNNVQEVNELMIKRHESGRVEVSNGVKISPFPMR